MGTRKDSYPDKQTLFVSCVSRGKKYVDLDLPPRSWVSFALSVLRSPRHKTRSEILFLFWSDRSTKSEREAQIFQVKTIRSFLCDDDYGTKPLIFGGRMSVSYCSKARDRNMPTQRTSSQSYTRTISTSVCPVLKHLSPHIFAQVHVCNFLAVPSALCMYFCTSNVQWSPVPGRTEPFFPFGNRLLIRFLLGTSVLKVENGRQPVFFPTLLRPFLTRRELSGRIRYIR